MVTFVAPAVLPFVDAVAVHFPFAELAGVDFEGVFVFAGPGLISLAVLQSVGIGTYIILLVD